jgi:hypothetical protein
VHWSETGVEVGGGREMDGEFLILLSFWSVFLVRKKGWGRKEGMGG